LLLALLLGLCKTHMKVIGKQLKEYFIMFKVQFSLGFIIVQKHLLYWLVSLIPITGDPDDRKSTASYVFTLGSGPITWACKKQSVISLSSVEAEYRGVVEANKEALWLRQIVSEFGFQQQHPTTLWCDNQSAIQLCKDLVQHQLKKHIELYM